MKKLYDFVKVVENNEECVILEVTGSMLDLIKLGCFNGNEKMFRLTKGTSHTCTVWTDNDNYSWFWGTGGHTLVSDDMTKRGKMIEKCITDDFEIYIGKNKEMVRKTLYKVKPTHARHEVKLMYWPNNRTHITVHIDNEFAFHIDGIDKAIKHFEDHGYEVKAKDTYTAITGCIVEQYKIIR